jgi:hypothetical protein
MDIFMTSTRRSDCRTLKNTILTKIIRILSLYDIRVLIKNLALEPIWVKRVSDYSSDYSSVGDSNESWKSTVLNLKFYDSKRMMNSFAELIKLSKIMNNWSANFLNLLQNSSRNEANFRAFIFREVQLCLPIL